MPKITAIERQFAGTVRDQWRIRTDSGGEEYIPIRPNDVRGSLQRWIDRTAPRDAMTTAAKAIREYIAAEPDISKLPLIVNREITEEKVIIAATP